MVEVEVEVALHKSTLLKTIHQRHGLASIQMVQQPRQLQTAALVSSPSIPVVQHRLSVLPQESTAPTIEQKQRHFRRQQS